MENHEVTAQIVQDMTAEPPKVLWKYRGSLGRFEYDPDMFRVIPRKVGSGEVDVLQYCGMERDGANIIVPDGLEDASYMFMGKAITSAPDLPFTVKRANYTFAGCRSLLNGARLPYGLEQANFMYKDCKMLLNGSDQPDTLLESRYMYQGCICLQYPGRLSMYLRAATGMYDGCRNLVQQPDLPDEIEETANMFRGCTAMMREQQHLMY